MELIKNIEYIIPFMDYYSIYNVSLVNKELNDYCISRRSSFTTKKHEIKSKLTEDNCIYFSIKCLKNLRTIYIEFKSIKDKHIACIQNMTQLKELSINGCHDITNELFADFDLNVKLDKLELYWMPQITNITRLLQSSTSMKYLNLSGCKNMLLESLQVITKFTNLEHLDLTRCVSVDDTLILEIAEKCQKLKYLNLYALPMLKCDFMSKLSLYLEFLDVCGNQYVTDDNILSLECTLIKSLNLVRHYIYIYIYSIL